MPASRRGFGSMLAALIVVALVTGCAFARHELSEVAVVPRRRRRHRLPPLAPPAPREVTSSSSAGS